MQIYFPVFAFFQDLTWNDNRCDTESAGYVCKSNQILALIPQTEAPLVGCPSQTKYDRTHNAACYKFVKGNVPVTWSSASSTCQSFGAELTSIESRLYLKNDVWEKFCLFSSVSVMSKHLLEER